MIMVSTFNKTETNDCKKFLIETDNLLFDKNLIIKTEAFDVNQKPMTRIIIAVNNFKPQEIEFEISQSKSILVKSKFNFSIATKITNKIHTVLKKL